jgi:hypothetical protein
LDAPRAAAVNDAGRAARRARRARKVRAGAALAARATSRPVRAALALAIYALSGLAGCSGQRTFLTGGPTVGQLKTGLSHLEFENQQLKNSVAKLERESRNIEDRLVQEQIDNGELTARLDDARNLLRERGIDADLRLGSRREDDRTGESVSKRSGSQARVRADGSSAKSRRKPPFAEIPAPYTAPQSHEPQDAADEVPRTGRAVRRRTGDDGQQELDHHASSSAGLQWLPVASGASDSATTVR